MIALLLEYIVKYIIKTMKQKWIVCIIVLLFTFPCVLYAKEIAHQRSSKNHTHKKNSKSTSYDLQQVASFKSKKNAEKMVRKLSYEGQESVIRKSLTKDKKATYRVFVKKAKISSKTISAPGRFKQEPVLEKTTIAEKYTDMEIYSEKLPESSKHTSSDKAVKHIASYRIFDSIEDAEKLASQLREDGYAVSVRTKTDKNDRIIYTVFAESAPDKPKVDSVHDEIRRGSISEEPSVEAKPSEKEISYTVLPEMSDTTSIASAPIVNPETTIEKGHFESTPVETDKAPVQVSQASNVSKGTTSPGEISQKADAVQPSSEDKKIDTSQEKSSEIFGRKGGYVHPFLGVTEYWTDNVFNTKTDKQSDFITLLSPGVWLTVPHVYEKLLSISTSSAAPGGYSLSRYSPETFTRYQTYLFYNADIELHSSKSAGNAVSHKAEGLFQYNLRGGLSFELADQFLATHDAWGTGISDELDKYRTNLANLVVTYDTGHRLMFRLDYANYLVDYTASRNKFRDRLDNSFAAYIFYKLRPKTALFYEYAFVDVDYRDNIVSNSKEHNQFVGIQWDMTAKSKGSIKAGYGLKDFNDSSTDDSRNFIFEAQIDHKLTPKTSLLFSASRKTEETDVSTTDYVLSDSVSAEYLQRLTGKITFDAKLSYTHDRYHDDLTYGGITETLEDDYYMAMLALQYRFREWLQIDTGYIFDKRESSFSDFDYTSNIFFLKFTGSL
jgi:polysaccharide biosynthesis protein VpsM